MLSSTAEYALRAVLCLADQAGRPLTTRQIAATTKVPAGYLVKVLQALSRAGLVTSQRGIHGGSVLTAPPEKITILRVINAVDPVQRVERCPLGLAGHRHQLCPLHRRIDEAAGMIEKAFAATTLAELLAEPDPCRGKNGGLAGTCGRAAQGARS